MSNKKKQASKKPRVRVHFSNEEFVSLLFLLGRLTDPDTGGYVSPSQFVKRATLKYANELIAQIDQEIEKAKKKEE